MSISLVYIKCKDYEEVVRSGSAYAVNVSLNNIQCFYSGHFSKAEDNTEEYRYRYTKVYTENKSRIPIFDTGQGE